MSGTNSFPFAFIEDSTGLLLLTNDGRLHHRLSHPSFNHEKEYEVTVARPMPGGALRKLAEGLPMMGTRTRPARVKRLSARRFRIVLREGKNRQIRRMVRKVGNQITHLKRIRIANIRLGNLPSGSWRHLTRKEKENPKIIDGRRRYRISKGSGRPVQEINQLLKSYMEMKKYMKKPFFRKMLKKFDFSSKMR